jgi:hypothetical protein
MMVTFVQGSKTCERPSLSGDGDGFLRGVAGYRSNWLQVKCHRCETEASIPLDAVRRPRDTPIWKLEAALKCRSCRKGRYAPLVHMIKLNETRQTTPYRWVHPDDDDRR